MKRFKNILYFADGATETCSSLVRAVNLAIFNQTRLTVVDVIGEINQVNPELEQRLGITMQQLQYDNRMDELTALIEPYQQANCAINIQILQGTPFVEVIRAVQKQGFDLVIKAANPTVGLIEHFFGSTDLRLLRKCPCPVWIDRPRSQGNYCKILAAIDPTRDFDQARLVLDLATSLAERENATLAVVHAWHLIGESSLRHGRAKLPDEEVDQLLGTEQKFRTEKLNEILKPYGLNTDMDEVKLIKGYAASTILAQEADLIVMGTIGRSGIQGLIIGNTAEQVLRSVSTAVLAVKPADFRSPIV